MPVEINNKRVFVVDSEGREFQIPEQAAQIYSEVKIVCDGPHCAGGGSGPTTYEWDEHDVQTGKYVLPEMFKETFWIQVTDGQRFVFCGTGCGIGFLKLGLPKPAEPSGKVVQFPVNGKSEGA